MSRLRGGPGSRGCWQGEIFVVHVHSDEVGRVWFRRADITVVCRGNKDRAARVSSLTNEEPVMVVETRVDIVGEVVGEDRGYGRDGMVGERETTLRSGGRGSVRQQSSGIEDGYISRGWGVCGHRGSEVFATWGGDENVVGVDGDVLVERSKEQSVEDFLGYARGSWGHGDWGLNNGISLSYNARRPGFLRGIFGWLS